MADYVVAKYIRLSMDDTQSASMSIENQRLLLDKHIAGLEIPNSEILEFVDNGYTGLNFERPAVQELLELVREGRVNCIAVKDFSRFGRNAIEAGYFIERVFPLYRVRFISVSDDFDSDEHEGGTGGMEMAFKFLAHEQYSRDLSQKIKSAKHEKAKRGELVRKDCLFGYKLNEARLMVVDEPAAETVRLIFALKRGKNSLAQIATRLYEQKCPTPYEHKKKTANPSCIWGSSVIRHILNDEQYIGTYIAGRKQDLVKIPDHHPAIIAQTLFDEVQAVIGMKATPRRKRKVGTHDRYGNIQGVLKGKVICACCNHVMRPSCTKSPRFACHFTRIAADAECHRLSISARELEAMLFEIMSKQAQIILGADNVNEAVIEPQSDYARQIERIAGDRLKLYERFVLGEINADEYKTAKAHLDDEFSAWRRFTARSRRRSLRIESARGLRSKSPQRIY